jgi:hypothetical protein
MSFNRYLRVLAALGAAGMVAGAGVAQADSGPPGDVPDNQAFVTFRSAEYSLKVPEGWPRTRQGVRVTFADKYNSIGIVTSGLGKRPTVGSVTKTELRELRKTTKGFAQPKVTTARRHAGTAILVTYRATSAPSAVTGKTVINDVERYEFWRAGKLAVLTLQAPRGSDNVDQWKIVTDSFAWTS